MASSSWGGPKLIYIAGAFVAGFGVMYSMTYGMPVNLHRENALFYNM